MDFQFVDFRAFLESKIGGATCYWSERGLEVILPRGFRKQDHLGVFDELMACWGKPFIAHHRNPKAARPLSMQ